MIEYATFCRLKQAAVASPEKLAPTINTVDDVVISRMMSSYPDF
jgi:hypothetical protein